MSDHKLIISKASAPLSASPYGDHNLLQLYLLKFDRTSTQIAYQRDLRDFFKTDHVALQEVLSIDFIQMNEYISELEKQGYKASTIKRKLAAIRGFFDWLIALGVLNQNPAHKQLVRKIRQIDHRNRRILYLTGDEARRLIEATSKSGKARVRDRALILTLLYCVLRRSEAAAMDVEHLRPLGRYWVLDIPHAKGGADQYVKVPDRIVEEIERMKQHYGITTGPLWRSFSPNNRNGRLSPHSIYTIVRKAAERAGLSRIGAHTLRHTGCTLAIEAGATIQQVQNHARHKSIETTMTYVHQRDRLRDSAADFINIDDI
ncbi:integrase [Candidatus Parcubacteria bacterium]|nr:MAG: integrase [Candidatus Parcubacteria bacterium]